MGALSSKQAKSIIKVTSMTVRIRSVGPMTLADYTEQELAQLRQVVGKRNSKIKYLALSRTDKELHVVAQANDKVSNGAWREALGHRLVIKPSGSIHESIEALKRGPGSFEEYGLYGRHPGECQNKHAISPEDRLYWRHAKDGHVKPKPQESKQQEPQELKRRLTESQRQAIKLFAGINKEYVRLQAMHKREDRIKIPPLKLVRPEDARLFKGKKLKAGVVIEFRRLLRRD
jgi:hypothetical protein